MASMADVRDELDGEAIEQLLVSSYPDLALLLRRTASLHAWQPSAVGDHVLRQLSAAVADVLQRRLSPDDANQAMEPVIAQTTAWLAGQRQQLGRDGTRT
jgi:hypothetical protein